MYEYEIYFPATDENMLLFAYSDKNLRERYPKIDPNTYVIVGRCYAD